MYRSKGKIVYDHLPDAKNFEPWWMMVLCDYNIQKYYAWHLKKWGISVNTSTPWGCHISVVKGEIPKKPEFWNYLNGKVINFEYDPYVHYSNNKHAWVNVYCEDLIEIRDKLGLIYRPRFHLTIGRLDV